MKFHPAQLVLVVTLALLFNLPAMAATHTVCASGCDYSSIQAAVNAAADGDVLSLSNETFVEGDIFIDKTLTIQAASGQPIIDGDGEDYVFEIGSDGIVTLDSLRLENATRALLSNKGFTTLKTVYVQGDGVTSTVYGGIANFSTGFLVVKDSSVISLNISTSLGGGITNFGEVQVVNSTLTANEGRLGGAIYNSKGDVSVSTSSISFNHATVRGGGYANAHTGGGAVIVHSNSSYSGNTAATDCDTYYDIHRSPSCVN